MIAVDIVASVISFNPPDFIIFYMQTQAQRLPQLTEQAPQTILSSSLRIACCTAAAAVRIPNGKDTPPAASASEPSAADFTNVLRLTPVCCFSPGITHSIVVIISLYIDNYNEIINMLMM